MSRPPAVVPVASIEGGGGTTAGPLPPRTAGFPANVRCSVTGNCGAGATTCARPILISPNLWISAACTTGGGAIAACINEGDCVTVAITRGAGATTLVGKAGSLTSAAERTVAANGTVGRFCGHATMLGIATSRFNLSLGGTTMV